MFKSLNPNPKNELAVVLTGAFPGLVLYQDENTQIKSAPLESKQLLENFLTSIIDFIKKESLSLNQIQKIYFADSPGSYTSLRLGLSTLKALCISLKIPLIVVDGEKYRFLSLSQKLKEKKQALVSQLNASNWLVSYYESRAEKQAEFIQREIVNLERLKELSQSFLLIPDKQNPLEIFSHFHPLKAEALFLNIQENTPSLFSWDDIVEAQVSYYGSEWK